MDSGTVSPRREITSVEKQTRRPERYDVFLDGEYAFSVHEDIVIEFRLWKGAVLDDSLLERIQEGERKHQAFRDAVRYVGRKPRSSAEVRLMLKRKDVPEEWIDAIIERLVQQRIVDDEQFARVWTEHRMLSQSKGKRWVRQELRMKGIARDSIDQALADVNEEQEFDMALRLGRRRWDQTMETDPPSKKRKIANFLLRRGYSGGIVQRVLRQIAGANDDSDLFYD